MPWFTALLPGMILAFTLSGCSLFSSGSRSEFLSGTAPANRGSAEFNLAEARGDLPKFRPTRLVASKKIANPPPRAFDYRICDIGSRWIDSLNARLKKRFRGSRYDRDAIVSSDVEWKNYPKQKNVRFWVPKSIADWNKAYLNKYEKGSFTRTTKVTRDAKQKMRRDAASDRFDLVVLEAVCNAGNGNWDRYWLLVVLDGDRVETVRAELLYDLDKNFRLRNEPLNVSRYLYDKPLIAALKDRLAHRRFTWKAWHDEMTSGGFRIRSSCRTSRRADLIFSTPWRGSVRLSDHREMLLYRDLPEVWFRVVYDERTKSMVRWIVSDGSRCWSWEKDNRHDGPLRDAYRKKWGR